MPRSTAVRLSRAPAPSKKLPSEEVFPGCHPPLNRDGSFKLWPSFDPGRFVDMNPSIVRLGAKEVWVVFCRYATPPEPGQGSIWAVRVDADLQPAGVPVLLLRQGIDPRVIKLGKRILIFLAMIERDAAGRPNGSSVVMAEFALDADQWTSKEIYVLPKRPIQGDLSAEADANWEKNWVPFAIDETHVGLIYSHEPWDVLTLCVEPGQPPKLKDLHRNPGLTWDDGTIRGGTSPVPFDENHLITFFHAAQNIGSRRLYSAGACVFNAKAPYQPVLMTREPLLLAPYKSGAVRFGWRFAGSVIFPMGAEAVRDGFNLLCGIDDGEIGSFLIRAKELNARLEPPLPLSVASLHDYRGGRGSRLPQKGLLFVPDEIQGIPELAMINFLRKLAGRGRTFVDAGSNIGFYTMALAPGFKKVIAFEPSRFQYDWLTRNRALNDYAHVACEHAALGDTRGETTVNSYTVQVEVLDDRGMSDVDLMKIDAKGFEIPVLRGAKKTIETSLPVILIEVQADIKRRQDVQAVMDEMNYTFEPMFPLSPERVLCLPKERRDSYSWFI